MEREGGDACFSHLMAGDILHHYQTGRTGIVLTEHYNGWQLWIQFNLTNAAGMPDGKTEKRNRGAFIKGPSPNVSEVLN
jgi:hypothetical protein